MVEEGAGLLMKAAATGRLIASLSNGLSGCRAYELSTDLAGQVGRIK